MRPAFQINAKASRNAHACIRFIENMANSYALSYASHDP